MTLVRRLGDYAIYNHPGYCKAALYAVKFKDMWIDDELPDMAAAIQVAEDHAEAQYE